jgi:hypothetical protein
LEYLFVDEYYMAHTGEHKYMDDPNAQGTQFLNNLGGLGVMEAP